MGGGTKIDMFAITKRYQIWRTNQYTAYICQTYYCSYLNLFISMLVLDTLLIRSNEACGPECFADFHREYRPLAKDPDWSNHSHFAILELHFWWSFSEAAES